MKGIRKLLSLNVALFFMLSSLITAVPVGAEEIAGIELEQFIIIDGNKYDVTKRPRGDSWRVYYDAEENDTRLILDEYTGGSIYANIGIEISLFGRNSIAGNVDYGIGVKGDLFLSSVTVGDVPGSLTVSGADGYAAIHVTGTFTFNTELTAIGGGISAFYAGAIRYTDHWPTKVLVGDSAATAVEGSYSGQSYVDIRRIPYILTLDGNGGKTTEDKASKDVYLTTGTMGRLFLYPHKDTFTNGDSRLLGWTDKEDGSGAFHVLEEEYIFPPNAMEATIFARWEDGENKAVLLKDYCGYHDYGVWDKLIACKTGEKYILPEPAKAGCTFKGWLGEDGEIYPAGTAIHVNESISFQAQYKALTLTIDGVEYDASKSQGSYQQGWYYFASTAYASQLNIYKDYSGVYFDVPCNVRVYLYRSLTGAEGKPLIHGAGNVFINVGYDTTETLGSIRLLGGSGSPAISAKGDIKIDVATNEADMQLLISGGEPGMPALSAGGTVRINEKVFHAGTDEENLKLVGKYTGEHCLLIKDAANYSIELSGTTTVPSVPENDDYVFVIWACDRYGRLVWYRPGDAIEAGNGKTLEALYLNKNRLSTIIVIDGNGGKAANNSNYYVVHNDITPYTLPTSSFAYSGHTLKGFNTKKDGSGENYAAGATLSDDGKTLIYELYAQWQKDGGGGGGGSGGGAAAADSIADAIKQAGKNGSVTLEPAASGKDVTLMAEHMGELLAKNLSVEIKTNTGLLKLPAETLAKLDKENTGEEIRITLDKGTDTDNISVGGLFLNLSVLAGGKEIHDVAGSARIRLDSVHAGNVVTVVHYNNDGTVKEVSFVTAKENGIVEFDFVGLSYYSLLLRSETPAYLVFRDIGEKAWYGQAASYAYQNELFDGTSETTFSPDITMNREMFATVLYRLAGSPEVRGESSFTDVTSSGAYYFNAILWAAENKIINGYPNGNFGVGDPVTREQMVAMLYRYAKDYAKADVNVGAEDKLLGYTDKDKISKGMYDALRWAVGTGVLRGTTVMELSPQTTATRAEVSQVLMNYGRRK